MLWKSVDCFGFTKSTVPYQWQLKSVVRNFVALTNRGTNFFRKITHIWEFSYPYQILTHGRWHSLKLRVVEKKTGFHVFKFTNRTRDRTKEMFQLVNELYNKNIVNSLSSWFKRFHSQTVDKTDVAVIATICHGSRFLNIEFVCLVTRQMASLAVFSIF